MEKYRTHITKRGKLQYRKGSVLYQYSKPMKLCDVMLASNGMYELDIQLYSVCRNLENTKDEMSNVLSMDGPIALRGMFTDVII